MDTGVLRCEFEGGCLDPGELCWEGQPTNCCPSGPGGGMDLCLDTILGLQRCYTDGTDDECLDDGEPCAFGDECCNGVCSPDANGDLVCGSCVPLQAACTSDYDCCEGICDNGSCVPNYYDCTPIGQACTEDEDCCTGICDDASGLCLGPS